ncbi:hypothetical protein [Nostoc sp. FACHB-892]|uniref:hypothetical protein n=1 Tax=Nostoc sp. FACHB-892 TaxID=2692843 RepID=UPI001A7E6B14|nr:hypothetical protein [Nostoc sp. FACHB-892]
MTRSQIDSRGILIERLGIVDVTNEVGCPSVNLGSLHPHLVLQINVWRMSQLKNLYNF